MRSSNGHWRWYPIVGAIAFCADTANAQKGQQDIYDDCRKLYIDGQHDKSIECFQKAIEGATNPASPPTLTDPALVPKGRMIWGAAEMYKGGTGRAHTQFDIILRANINFQPEPLIFPTGVRQEFEERRKKMQALLTGTGIDEKLKKELADAKDEIARLKKQIEGLKAWGEKYEVVTKHSRVIASIPFGVGQFQNGDNTVGVAFLVGEVVALGTAFGTYVWHETIPKLPQDPERAASLESTSKYLNWVSSATFAFFAIGGIVHAHVTFKPSESREEKRDPPRLARVKPIFAVLPSGGFLGISAAF